MSMPLLSSGGACSASICTPCLILSHSIRQWLGDATLAASTRTWNSLLPLPPSIFTGRRNRGARASRPLGVRCTRAPTVR